MNSFSNKLPARCCLISSLVTSAIRATKAYAYPYEIVPLLARVYEVYFQFPATKRERPMVSLKTHLRELRGLSQRPPRFKIFLDIEGDQKLFTAKIAKKAAKAAKNFSEVIDHSLAH